MEIIVYSVFYLCLGWTNIFYIRRWASVAVMHKKLHDEVQVCDNFDLVAFSETFAVVY